MKKKFNNIKDFLLTQFFDNWVNMPMILIVLFCFATAITFNINAKPLPIYIPAITFLTSCILSILFSRICKSEKFISYHHFLKYFFITLSFIAFGFLTATISIHKNNNPKITKPIYNSYISGKIISSEQLKDSYRIVLNEIYLPKLKYTNTPAPKKIRIRTLDKNSKIEIGQTVKFKGNLNPLPKPSYINGFNFSKYAYFKQIGALGINKTEIEPNTKYIKSKYYKPNSLLENTLYSFLNLRIKMNERISQVLKEDTKDISMSVITGQRYVASLKLSEKFLNTGITHILSISGFHMGVIALMSIFILRYLTLFLNFIPRLEHLNTKKLSYITALIPITFYLIISGARLPTLRAYLMVVLAILIVLFNREIISKRNVFLTAFILILIDPASIFNSGFLLSFTCVLALVSIYQDSKILRKKMAISNIQIKNSKNRFTKTLNITKSFLLGNLTTNIIVWIFTLPLTMYFFGSVSLISVITNFIVIPIFTIIVMPAILAFYIFFPIEILSNFFLKIVGFGIDLIISTVNYIDSFGNFLIQTPYFDTSFLPIVSIALLWIFIIQGKAKLFAIIPFIISAIIAIQTIRPDIIISHNSNLLTIKKPDEIAFLPLYKKHPNSYSIFDILKAYGLNKNQISAGKTNGEKYCKDKICEINIKNKTFLLLQKSATITDEKLQACKYEFIINYTDKVLQNNCNNILDKQILQENIITEIYIKNDKIKTRTFKEKYGQMIWN